jgi:hypothetical protein
MSAIANRDAPAAPLGLGECSICLDHMVDGLRKLVCQHIFHRECVEQWFEDKSSCPICRRIDLPTAAVLENRRIEAEAVRIPLGIADMLWGYH